MKKLYLWERLIELYWPSHGQLLSRTPRQRPRLVNFQSKAPHWHWRNVVSLLQKSQSRYERLTLENTPRFYKQKNSIYLNPCMIVFGKEIFSERNICFSNKLLGNIYFIDKHIYVLAWHLKKKCSQSTLHSYVFYFCLLYACSLFKARSCALNRTK